MVFPILQVDLFIRVLPPASTIFVHHNYEVAFISLSDVWIAYHTTAQQHSQVLDVFIVLDESGSVGEDNYHTAIDFVRNFIQDLDRSVRASFMYTAVHTCCDITWTGIHE